MDPIQLRAFVAVAEDLHFGRAAQRLHIAQPYLSRTIRALEEDLGAPLFRRTTRRVELTPAGAALVDRARAILAMGDEARASVAAAHEGRSGRVRIGFAGPSAHDAVGQLARAVRQQHPLIDLVFLPGRYGASVLSDLLRHDSDLALARFAEPPAEVSSRGIARDRCVVAVPTSHRLAQAEELRFDDFRDEPFVAFPESFGSSVRAILVSGCQAVGFAPRFVQIAPDSWTSIALVSAGVGLHFTTATAVAHLPLDGVHICEIADPPAISVYLLWRQGDDDPVLHRVLRTSVEVLPGAE
ncbi:LysR family transcriptional regulator [Pseudonocardia alaniniphila]|uniref:LysR substrate-binding domain-containing protein n=1 Tax=Pseudonocardia alaniniphila TaxID=75291 RepID=A0ABS9TTH6_9PSEU|nr:LysR substrate-binding domain-containing protein [Pseudonocardia alaniniphila]MCH6171802.1 LysR substrate-binding domain-containing protein [Pseudonocardia alaniniphila]